MSDRNTILEEISRQKNLGQDIVRKKYIQQLASYTHNDTVVYVSSFGKPGIPSNAIQISNDDIQGFMTCLKGLSGTKLDLILHSPGGSLEAAEQIVQYLRSKYDYIRVIVPQNAMSAATMISCAADEIVMGKESAIGPIDPQMMVPGPNNSAMSIPAHSILEDFERAKAEVAANPAVAPIWVPKIMAIPPGYLNLCKQTIDLSKEKVATWLDTYMFKNTEKKGSEIAEFLGNFGAHKTHGRPINYDIAKEKGLNVTRLEDDQILQDYVLSVYHAAMITIDVTTCVKMIENQNEKGYYITVAR